MDTLDLFTWDAIAKAWWSGCGFGLLAGIVLTLLGSLLINEYLEWRAERDAEMAFRTSLAAEPES
ncbi:hypothetical protein Tcur_0676 [Thermomonospora curvata DSM 43183]|uniref:Uncharacterized protein n=1 Tax=Thermomonospora curvata (strain ATCC 19995 / DSM 43183 / JCM 3096 / KCTC 9072 / NBRC 15933 / NCIMB 10081 / Henssen B9) TaxID=471852 RepID=D1A4N4_THECD|nr:hypothetical protein Tcur_0676 [Thermomonospora curvata DSM 43183]